MTRLMRVLGMRLGVGFLLVCWPSLLAACAEDLESSQSMVTNVDKLRGAIPPGAGRICAFRLEGTVLAADRDSGIVFFQDTTGVAVLNMKLEGQNLQAGQKIQMCGTNYVSYAEIGLADLGFTLGTSPVIDNDGAHSLMEKSSVIFLASGRHPIQVNWFNWVAMAHLDVAYAGLNSTQQPIPDDVLWQTGTASDNGPVRSLPGLRYRCFEGPWTKLPDFDRLTLTKAGVVSNFDIGVRSSAEHAGLEFKGFLDVPRDGNYTFYLSSDDGSQLFLDSLPPNIRILGTVPPPAPLPINVGQPLPASQDFLWGEVEGMVTFLANYRGEIEIELASGGNRMRVEVLTVSPEVPWYLLHSRVRVSGICPNMKNPDGQNCAALIVAANWQNVRVLGMAPEQWPAFRDESISDLSNAVAAGDRGGIAHLRGRLRGGSATPTALFEDATGGAPIQLLGEGPVETGTAVECLSRWYWDGTKLLLQQAVCRQSPNESGGGSNAVHVLTTALQVQQLKPDEAQRQYPVEIQGVVTYVSGDLSSVVIQDSTRAVYVATNDQSPRILLHLGDYCKIQGVTLPGDFSPVVSLRKATRLGKGEMPQPVSPTREQLLSGSLDAQYVELRGMVTATHDSYVTLLTAAGTFNVEITPGPGEPWEKCLNAIIRVRGCFFANWANDRRVVLDRPILRVSAATVSIDTPAPTDLFQADKIKARELMHFDPRFNTFRWVKVSGQIVHRGSDLYYLMDGATGLRFQLAQPRGFDPGDDAEVVGLVELGGASPLLRQAAARKIGRSPLRNPQILSLNSLNERYESTLVSVEGALAAVKDDGSEQVLEMQVGVKGFAARLTSKPSSLPPMEIGSRLKLTGVFCSLGGNQTAEHEVSSFELLLNSPADVQVVARPPWWTLGRLLVVATLLVVGLALAFVWITLLRHQVERRTRQLRHEIGERERAEKIRAVEQERSRIARDLHDDLGSELTEISMLASASPGLKIEPETAAERLREIAEKSRSMVSALDGVVWVTNSKNDTLSSLVEYLASYAEEFLAKARTACRVELPAIHADRVIAAEFRHDVLLAVREALNNAVRHSRPSKVLLRLVVSEDSLEILIQDDGCGFKTGDEPGGNGLVNLHERMHKLGGHCQIQSSPSAGTSVILRLPLSG